MTARTAPAVHVYCGPTITAAEVLEIIPGASIHPPVQHGDVLRLAVRAGDTVIIIDGVFHAVAAVRHKEILDLLARGVHVVGAASMGALRAAELYPYGMTGIGGIFAAYRDGIIDADDEVAVAHTADGRQLSEALADIRALAAAAAADGVWMTRRQNRSLRSPGAFPTPSEPGPRSGRRPAARGSRLRWNAWTPGGPRAARPRAPSTPTRSRPSAWSLTAGRRPPPATG